MSFHRVCPSSGLVPSFRSGSARFRATYSRRRGRNSLPSAPTSCATRKSWPRVPSLTPTTPPEVRKSSGCTQTGAAKQRRCLKQWGLYPHNARSRDNSQPELSEHTCRAFPECAGRTESFECTASLRLSLKALRLACQAQTEAILLIGLFKLRLTKQVLII